MHFSSEINRPPYEAQSGYLQVTSGCSTHNKCAFCIFYQDSRFKESSIQEIESDLTELRNSGYAFKRLFLQGADPFVLGYDQLMKIADLIHRYLPTVESIGGYARINNIVDKSVSQLTSLSEIGYSNPYFGIESGDDYILKSMNKGYSSELIAEQCAKMDTAGFRYIANFLNGLGGHGYGLKNARDTASIYNNLHPTMIYVSSLTLMPGSRLHQLAKNGRYQESTELEKLEELKEFINCLTTKTRFKAEHVSIAVPLAGYIPDDKQEMIATLQNVIDHTSENRLKNFRKNIVSL